MEAKLAPSTNLLALPDGTELVGDYRIQRVLGAGGFGITYLADESALGRLVTIKEYFPAEFAARRDRSAVPRSRGVTEEYKWGLDRFIEEAQTLARFDHPNIVRVHRYFRANDTGYMVLKFEEGGSFKAWLKNLKRPPLQAELDNLVAPLLDALEIIHNADFLHRDIAPDNIMVRKDGSPVLIDFGSARGALATQSRTVSALVKPGYSPYEQYATSGSNQGPWTDIYALGATLYHAITGRRPPDAPSRVVNDEYVTAGKAALGEYRSTFLAAIDKALRIDVGRRPQRVADWRGPLLTPEPKSKPKSKSSRASTQRASAPRTLAGRLDAAGASPVAVRARPEPAPPEVAVPTVPASLVPVPPDAPQPKGQLLDFIEGLKKKHRAAPPEPVRPKAKAPSEPAPRKPPTPSPAATLSSAMVVDNISEPPSILHRRTRGKPRRAWRRTMSRWGSISFRVAMAVFVSSLAVAYEQRTRPSGGARAAPFMQLNGHQGPVIAVASSDEDRWIVSAGADATVRVWNASSGLAVSTISLPEGAVTAFAVDQHRALVGHQHGIITLWDLVSGTKLATFRHGTDSITSVAFLGDRFVVARPDGGVASFDLGAPGKPAVLLDTQEGGGNLIAAAGARRLMVTTGFDRTMRVWRGPEPHVVRTYHLTNDCAAVDIAPDAGYMAGGSVNGVVRVQRSPAWRGPYPFAVKMFKAHEGPVTAIALGSSGMLASAGQDGSLKLWTLQPQRVMRALEGGQVRTLSFSRDGQRLLAGGQDGVIRVWSMASLPPPARTM